MNQFEREFSLISDLEDLKKRWRMLLMQWHPDHAPDKASVTAYTEIAKAVNAAYSDRKQALELQAGFGGRKQPIWDDWMRNGFQWGADPAYEGSKTHDTAGQGYYEYTKYDQNGNPYTERTEPRFWHEGDPEWKKQGFKSESAWQWVEEIKRRDAEKQREQARAEKRKKAAEKAKANRERKEREEAEKQSHFDAYEQANAEFLKEWTISPHMTYHQSMWALMCQKKEFPAGIITIVRCLINCAGCSIAYDDKYVVVSGNTYEHKETIKGSAINQWKWNGDLKVWWIVLPNPDEKPPF